MMTERAVFLDRDGVLNELVHREDQVGSPRQVEEFRILDEAGPAVTRLRSIENFRYATLLHLAAAGDLHVLRSGMPRGGPRLARHLWRMCFALFIAALCVWGGGTSRRRTQ